MRQPTTNAATANGTSPPRGYKQPLTACFTAVYTSLSEMSLAKQIEMGNFFFSPIVAEEFGLWATQQHQAPAVNLGQTAGTSAPAMSTQAASAAPSSPRGRGRPRKELIAAAPAAAAKTNRPAIAKGLGIAASTGGRNLAATTRGAHSTTAATQ